MVEYPALIYKNSKNNVFVANCIMKKLSGFGSTEDAALKNLESVLNKTSNEYLVKVKPVYGLMSQTV